jgi:hypothetical protein
LIIADHHLKEPPNLRYGPRQNWPDDTFVQWGPYSYDSTKGGKRRKNYNRAFFEVFIEKPSTYLRGEGRTIYDAEMVCFSRWERILNCPGHDLQQQTLAHMYACPHCDLEINISGYIQLEDHLDDLDDNTLRRGLYKIENVKVLVEKLLAIGSNKPMPLFDGEMAEKYKNAVDLYELIGTERFDDTSRRNAAAVKEALENW